MKIAKSNEASVRSIDTNISFTPLNKISKWSHFQPRTDKLALRNAQDTAKAASVRAELKCGSLGMLKQGSGLLSSLSWTSLSARECSRWTWVLLTIYARQDFYTGRTGGGCLSLGLWKCLKFIANWIGQLVGLEWKGYSKNATYFTCNK